MTPSQHSDYLAQIRQTLAIHRSHLTIRAILRSYARELLILATLTLDAVRDDLAALYCPTGQGAPRDPVALLRSLLLMTLCRVSGLDAWVTRLRREPVLAVLAGFAPQDVPGASTHRDFLTRVADGPYAVRCLQDQPLMQAHHGRHTRHLDDRIRALQDAVGPYHSQSDRLAADLLPPADTPRDPFTLQTRLELLLLTPRPAGRFSELTNRLTDPTAQLIADLQSERNCRELTTLKLTLFERDDHVISSDLYAKVTEILSEAPPTFRVHFTSVPPEVQAFFEKTI